MISLVRDVAERLRPPRVLHCDFPFGRPLGRPNDASFQRRVLDAAFGLLARDSGPVLEIFPERIDDESDAPLSCAVPPPMGTGRSGATEEALAYRNAYDRHHSRTGRTLVGRCIGADGIPDAMEKFTAVAEGRPWRDLAFPGSLTDVAMDVRAYYEQAAIELSGHVPGARSTDSWFFQSTLSGNALLAVQRMLRHQGEPQDLWFGIAPAGYGLREDTAQ